MLVILSGAAGSFSVAPFHSPLCRKKRGYAWPSSAFGCILSVLGTITLSSMTVGQISVGEGNVGWADTLKESHRKLPGRTLQRVPGSTSQRFCSVNRYGIETGCPHF